MDAFLKDFFEIQIKIRSLFLEPRGLLMKMICLNEFTRRNFVNGKRGTFIGCLYGLVNNILSVILLHILVFSFFGGL